MSVCSVATGFTTSWGGVGAICAGSGSGAAGADFVTVEASTVEPGASSPESSARLPALVPLTGFPAGSAPLGFAVFFGVSPPLLAASSAKAGGSPSVDVSGPPELDTDASGGSPESGASDGDCGSVEPGDADFASDAFSADDDDDDDVDDVDPSDSDGSAVATHGAMATAAPIPSATASAPTRPM